MKKYIVIAILFIVFLGCEEEDKPEDVCIPPSEITANENCYKLGDGLFVTATYFQRTRGGLFFHFELYPQTNSEEIDMSDAARTWATTGDNVIYIPSEYLENVTRFVIRVNMNCEGEYIGGVDALFELEATQYSCYEWVITTL